MLQKAILKINSELRKYIQIDPMENPLTGDRCVEYAYIVRNLINLNKNKNVLDVGCFASPLTSIMGEMGFNVDGIDLNYALPYQMNVNYFNGDFNSYKFQLSYDVIVMCSTIEHIGLGGRYNSPDYLNGDLDAIKKSNEIMNPEGILFLTIPFGKERVIKPFHRVYNKNGKLFNEIRKYYQIIAEEYYKNNSENIFVKCTEEEAQVVEPSENNYALGLFSLKKISNE